MESTINCIHSTLITKHGIRDMILESVKKFHFDKFLITENHLLVFVATYMRIILLNNPTAIYIAEKLSCVSHDAVTRLLPIISIRGSMATTLVPDSI